MMLKTANVRQYRTPLKDTNDSHNRTVRQFRPDLCQSQCHTTSHAGVWQG